METQAIKIRFSHCDPAGVMLFANAFELFHDHFEDFVTDHWKLPWDLYFANPKYAFPLVHIECDYVKPLKANDSVQLRFLAQIQGESSFKMTVEAFKGHEKCFVVQSIHAAMDKMKMQKAPLPEFLKTKL